MTFLLRGWLHCWARALGARAPVAVVHGFTCSLACGIFSEQESNPCPLQWQTDSLLLHRQGSVSFLFSFLKLISFLYYTKVVSLNFKPWHLEGESYMFLTWMNGNEYVHVLSHVWLFATPWTVACQSTEFSRPRILEWVAYAFSRGSSWPKNQTGVSCIIGGVFTSWNTREAPENVHTHLDQVLSRNYLDNT